MLIFVISMSCKSVDKKTEIDQLAISFNDQAVKQMQAQNLDSALVMIDKALSVDSCYVVGLANKVGIYIGLRDYKNALIVADKTLQVDPNYAEGYAGAGLLCEILGDTIKAFDYYKRGIDCYERRILHPKDEKQLTNCRLNRACLLRFCGKEIEGREELEKLKAEKQDIPLIDGLLKMDRHAYLKTIPR